MLINKKILTIGGADFIGFNVVRSLILGETSEVPLRNIVLPMTLSQFAVTKLASEHYLNILGHGQGPSSKYADCDPGFTKTIKPDGRHETYGDGEQTRTLLLLLQMFWANVSARNASTRCEEAFNIAVGKVILLNRHPDTFRKMVGMGISRF